MRHPKARGATLSIRGHMTFSPLAVYLRLYANVRSLPSRSYAPPNPGVLEQARSARYFWCASAPIRASGTDMFISVAWALVGARFGAALVEDAIWPCYNLAGATLAILLFVTSTSST